MSPELILKLLPLAIEAFGAVSQEVLELRAAAGLNDDQLLAAAEQANARTQQACQAHIDALKAAIAAGQATHPVQ